MVERRRTVWNPFPSAIRARRIMHGSTAQQNLSSSFFVVSSINKESKSSCICSTSMTSLFMQEDRILSPYFVCSHERGMMNLSYGSLSCRNMIVIILDSRFDRVSVVPLVCGIENELEASCLYIDVVSAVTEAY